LHPVDLTDPNWEASSYRGKAVVGAPSERSAREAAEHAFGVKTRFAPKKGVIVPPWKRPDLVAAALVETSIYDPEGATAVLYPAD
jgi:hypothetical protein